MYPSFYCISPCPNAVRRLSPYPTRHRLDSKIPSMAALRTFSPCSNRLRVCRPSWHSCKHSWRVACHPDQHRPLRIILPCLLRRTVSIHISSLQTSPCHVSQSPSPTMLCSLGSRRRTPVVSLVTWTASFRCLPVIIRRHKWRSSRDAEIWRKMEESCRLWPNLIFGEVNIFQI